MKYKIGQQVKFTKGNRLWKGVILKIKKGWIFNKYLIEYKYLYQDYKCTGAEWVNENNIYLT